MLSRPFDLNTPNSELNQASVWWRSLSINQMKAHQVQYFPDSPYGTLTKRWVHHIWEEEGKPAPETHPPIPPHITGPPPNVQAQ